jgi:hypothetical protein
MEPNIVQVTFTKQTYENSFSDFGPVRYEVKVRIDHEVVCVRDIPYICSPADSTFESIWRHVKHVIKMSFRARVEKKLKKIYELNNEGEQYDPAYGKEN